MSNDRTDWLGAFCVIAAVLGFVAAMLVTGGW